MTQLRSLYIPYMHDNGNIDVLMHKKELALQIVDIVTMRPEIKLCYFGIFTKCYEILEGKWPGTIDGELDAESAAGDEQTHEGEGNNENAEEGGGGGEEDDENSAVDSEEELAAAPESEDESPSSGEEDSDLESEYGKSKPNLRLREILFYDDKVAIFRARHGRL